MSPRSSVVPVLASGAASAAKLLVAILAFTGAYVGVEASQSAPVDARRPETGPHVQSITLTSRVLPITTTSAAAKANTDGATSAAAKAKADGATPAAAKAKTDGTKAGGAATSAAAGRVPAADEVTIQVTAVAPPCDKELRVRSLIANPDPESTVTYGWRLERWSAAAKEWKIYLAGHSGFAGEGKVVEWHPNVVGNPGWYRVELVTDAGRTHSERVQVSC
jgi:hypothetical protein